MKISVINEPISVISIQDFFTPDQLTEAWAEIESLEQRRNELFTENPGSAYRDDRLLKSNTGLFMQDVYPDPNQSVMTRAIFEALDSRALFPDSSYYFGEFNCGLQGFLLSNYGDEDYYEPHRDESLATLLIWLYKEPRKFTGGDFKFSDCPDLPIATGTNCGLLFPGRYKHEVSQVVQETTDPLDGRYCLSLFFDLAATVGNG